MKLVLAFFLFTASILVAQDPVYHDINNEFKRGQEYALFGDDVKFRKAPDVGSKVIDLLKIGTELEIVEKTDKTVLYNGIDSYFYKVKYKGDTGYVLGGLISYEKKERASITYLFAYRKKEFSYDVLIRTLYPDGQFTEIETTLGPTNFSVELYDNKGISGVNSILHIDNRLEVCGIFGDIIYFFQVLS